MISNNFIFHFIGTLSANAQTIFHGLVTMNARHKKSQILEQAGNFPIMRNDEEHPVIKFIKYNEVASHSC